MTTTNLLTQPARNGSGYEQPTSPTALTRKVAEAEPDDGKDLLPRIHTGTAMISGCL